jgi:hypothetical protein
MTPAAGERSTPEPSRIVDKRGRIQMTTAMTERLIRTQHPEKVLGYLAGLDDKRIAALFGLDLDSYQRVRQSHEEQARGAAADLLEDPSSPRKWTGYLSRPVNASWPSARAPPMTCCPGSRSCAIFSTFDAPPMASP